MSSISYIRRSRRARSECCSQTSDRARVLVARENALGREVVVKLLAPELSTSVSATATIVCSRATGSESLRAQAR